MMGLIEEFVGEQTRQAYKNERLAVLLSAIVFVLHFLEVKIEKVSVGGVELVIREPYVVKGSLGLVLIYLMLSTLRGALGKLWSLSIAEPDFRKKFDSLKNGYYYVYDVANSIVSLFEVGVLACAIVITWSDALRLVSVGWRALWA